MAAASLKRRRMTACVMALNPRSSRVSRCRIGLRCVEQRVLRSAGDAYAPQNICWRVPPHHRIGTYALHVHAVPACTLRISRSRASSPLRSSCMRKQYRHVFISRVCLSPPWLRGARGDISRRALRACSRRARCAAVVGRRIGSGMWRRRRESVGEMAA